MAPALSAILLLLATGRPITVSDLMAIRTVVDVRISPDGSRVAYVVSEASLSENEHLPTLYLVSSRGGEPKRLTYATRIFNRPVPRPEIRWSPDGTRLSFLAFVSDLPQVVSMDAAGGEPRPLTTSPTGVARYEWSRDSSRIAYLATEPEAEEEARQ
ncbi:MAG TPA: LpqB family beta-propeller domain-containing protein, partial [Vicinamibacteria bacterium]